MSKFKKGTRVSVHDLAGTVIHETKPEGFTTKHAVRVMLEEGGIWEGDVKLATRYGGELSKGWSWCQGGTKVAINTETECEVGVRDGALFVSPPQDVPAEVVKAVLEENGHG